MKKRSFRSTFVSVILVITVAISIVNLAVYGINIKKIRQVEVLKMKTAGERIDDMITISLNNIKGLKQICCTDNYARNILLKNNEKNDIGTKFENQNYMDNALKHIASMDTLILRARGGLSASMSGIPFWGFDMGGFYNTDHEGYECVPTDEEYIRSCQFGFFNSLSRCHGKTPREPWNFGEKAEKIFKKFNDIRHLLLPYLYSTTYKTHLSDIPVIRPVVMEYPEDRSARNVELEYFLGDSLLVVPVFDQEDEIDVYLPNGQWIDLFTHERIKGGRWVKRKIELDKIPVFIRQNKMIPMLTKIPENIEEKYENLDVILFCEDEIRDTYIDDGNVQNLKAKIEEGTLFINTDMDASYFTVYAEKCLDNAVVNGQNWEIKKEKEGYYKIALEK